MRGTRAKSASLAKSVSGPVVSYVDQAMLLLARGANQEAVIQAIWVYDHPVDLERLKEVAREIGDQRISRRIEKSPLPFCRPRWVVERDPIPAFTIESNARPVDELFDWADEQVNLPLDPVSGPGWRMSVLPLRNGSTAVSVIASHCVVDGFGSVDSVYRAITHQPSPDALRSVSYPAPHSRRLGSALVADLGQLARDAPEVSRSLVRAMTAAATQLRLAGRRAKAPGDASPEVATEAFVGLPTVVAHIDAAHLSEQATRLGGSTQSLLVAFALRLGQLSGRAQDGAVHLLLPLVDEASSDTLAANDVILARFAVGVADVSDLATVRTAMREGIVAARTTPDPMRDLLPLVPFIPRRAFRGLSEAAFGFADVRPVTLSSAGELPIELLQLDGTPADRLCFRGVDRRVTRDSLIRRGGLLSVFVASVGGTFMVNVVSFQPHTPNSRAQVRQLVEQTLDEFDVTASFM